MPASPERQTRADGDGAFIPWTELYARLGREYIECSIWRNRAVKFIDQIQPDVVLRDAKHTAGYSDADWIRGTSDLLARIAPHAGRVVIMQSTPPLPFDARVCVVTRLRFNADAGPGHACSAPAADAAREQRRRHGSLRRPLPGLGTCESSTSST